MAMKKTNLEVILISTLVVCLLAIVAYMGYFSAFTSKTNVEMAAQEQVQTPADDLTTVDKSVTSDNSSTNIHIFSPKKGDTIGLPLKILGEARVFESTYAVRLKEKGGTVLAEESGMTLPGDMGEFNLFTKEMNYPQPKGTEGILEVFQYSAKDGSEIDKVTIPIKFGYVNAMFVKVFFGNNKKDPNTTDCKKVYAVTRRVGWSKDTANIALQELLKGVSKSESEEGYFTSINLGVKINSISIKNGIANVDFDETLALQTGGSCKVAAIRAQITETLKQFGTVKDVIISINKQSEDILQP